MAIHSFAYNVKSLKGYTVKSFPLSPAPQVPFPTVTVFYFLLTYTSKILKTYTRQFIYTENYLYVMCNYICLLVSIRDSAPNVPIRITWETFRQCMYLHAMKTYPVFVIALGYLVCFLAEKHEPEM